MESQDQQIRTLRYLLSNVMRPILERAFGSIRRVRIDKSTCGNTRCYPMSSRCYATGLAQPNTHHIVYHCIAIDVTALGGGFPVCKERTTASGDNKTLPHTCGSNSWRPLAEGCFHRSSILSDGNARCWRRLIQSWHNNWCATLQFQTNPTPN